MVDNSAGTSGSIWRTASRIRGTTVATDTPGATRATVVTKKAMRAGRCG